MDSIVLTSGKNVASFTIDYIQTFTSVSEFVEKHITTTDWYTEDFLKDFYIIATTKKETSKAALKSADKPKD